MPQVTFSSLEAMTRGARPRGTPNIEEEERPSSNADPKRSRTANWRPDEVKALVDAVEPVYGIINGPHSNTLTEQDKRREWIIIQSKVNAMNITHRTLHACESKWSDYKSRVKAKIRSELRERGKTGGGEAERISMSEIEELLAGIINANEKKVMNLLGPTCLFGIEGGLDTSLTVPETVPVSDIYARETPQSSGADETPCTSGESIRRKSPTPRTDAGAELLKVQKEIVESTQKLAATFANMEPGIAEINKSLSRITTAMEEMLWFQKLRSSLDPNLSSSNYVVNMQSSNPSS